MGNGPTGVSTRPGTGEGILPSATATWLANVPGGVEGMRLAMSGMPSRLKSALTDSTGRGWEKTRHGGVLARQVNLVIHIERAVAHPIKQGHDVVRRVEHGEVQVVVPVEIPRGDDAGVAAHRVCTWSSKVPFPIPSSNETSPEPSLTVAVRDAVPGEIPRHDAGGVVSYGVEQRGFKGAIPDPQQHGDSPEASLTVARSEMPSPC